METRRKLAVSFLEDEPFDSSNPEGKAYRPPPPESAKDVAKDSAGRFMSEAKAAYDRGAWATDASHHARNKQVDPALLEGGTTLLEA